MPHTSALHLEVSRAAEARAHQEAAHARVYPFGCPQGCASCRRRLGQRGSGAGVRLGATLLIASAAVVVALGLALAWRAQ